jgi:hypothetical protein
MIGNTGRNSLLNILAPNSSGLSRQRWSEAGLRNSGIFFPLSIADVDPWLARMEDFEKVQLFAMR